MSGLTPSQEIALGLSSNEEDSSCLCAICKEETPTGACHEVGGRFYHKMSCWPTKLWLDMLLARTEFNTAYTNAFVHYPVELHYVLFDIQNIIERVCATENKEKRGKSERIVAESVVATLKGGMEVALKQ